jgi:uncharacterized phage protein (TIGR02218 family)
MKTFPAGLDTLLANWSPTSPVTFADLYQIALSDGVTVLRYTTADTDVLYAGNTYTSKGPFFDSLSTKSTAHWKAGLDMDTWQVNVAPAAIDAVTGVPWPAQIYGQPWLAAVRAGALDGATVDIHRAYWAGGWPVPWSSPLVPSYVLVDVFAGRVGPVQPTRTEALITINSHMEQLSRPLPRNVYGSGCRWTLFDAGCTLNRASFAVTGAVTAVSNNGFFLTNLSQVQDYFSLGMLTWTSGANVGSSKAIRSHAGSPSGALTLIAPMPFTVAPGDAFTAYPGCDKTLTTCLNKFNNLANNGSQPFIPSPETAV